MKNIYSISSIVLILLYFEFKTVCEAAPQQESSIQKVNNDGPYLIYIGNTVELITAKEVNNKHKIKIDSFNIQELPEKMIKVKPNSKMSTFSFKVFSYKPEPAYFDKPEKLLVVSDIEGNFEDFTKILRVAGVINKKYEWTYGANHLLINGDLFDRGNDVTAFLWLCYKLDDESRQNGGRVHITLGNHDEMNMKGDTRYVDSKYLNLDSLLRIAHKKLFDENTEIGRWLRTKNCITIIDSTLFVHGGISMDLIRQKLNPEQINQIVRENLGKEKSQMGKIPQFIFGADGPFWYRGLIVNNAQYKPVTPQQLDSVLLYFGVKRVVLGHCIVPEIIGLHNGKVIAADVDHYENKKAKRSRALLVTNNKFYTINDEGKIKDLPIVKGFGEQH